MIRTNIYLSRVLRQTLQRLAKEKGSSMAQLVRTFIEEKVQEEKMHQSGAEMLLEMAKRAKKSKGSGLGDLARNHDYYLYGKKRKD